MGVSFQTAEQLRGVSKEGPPQGPLLWSLREGVQRERESKLSPPGGFLGGRCPPVAGVYRTAEPTGETWGAILWRQRMVPQDHSVKIEGIQFDDIRPHDRTGERISARKGHAPSVSGKAPTNGWAVISVRTGSE